MRSIYWLVLGVLGACAIDTDSNVDSEEARVADGGPGGGPIAVTDRGPVRGLDTATTRQFRGIPYAAAPVGDLRWRPPEPHARWHGPLDATQFRPHCAQLATPFGGASTSEDCLFLNIYAPRETHPRSRLPVMVWIHGGGFIVGQGEVFDPTRMVETGHVIVVTINYRLGELGFLAHPALTAESPDHASGNYNLMDQQAALAWVQRNIAAFGGDPDRVTIFGESAGGLSVHAQLISPLTTHMFAGAISESGGYALALPTLAQAEAAGTAFAASVGCADQTAACLRAVPVETILDKQTKELTTLPNIEGKVLTQSIGAAFASGDFQRVPIIEGSNHDEWRLFVALLFDLSGAPLTPAAYPAAIASTLGVPVAAAPIFIAQYPLASYPSPDVALAALGTDAIFACNTLQIDHLTSAYVPTYAYELADENSPMPFLPPVSFPYGSTHSSELQYLFDPVNPAFDADQLKLSEAMIRAWTTFARTGKPGPHCSNAWPPFDGATIESLVPPSPTQTTGFAADHHCAFWGSF